jgi:hypothetical protein
VTRPVLTVLLAAALVAGCGEKKEPSVGGAGTPSGGQRSLTGCLKLWNGPHPGSTRLQTLVKSQTMFAKVEVKADRCQVAFASRDGKVYGRYVEQPNATGDWTQEATSAPVADAKQVVARANARAKPDGFLEPGAPG